MLQEPPERLVGRFLRDIVAASDGSAGDLGAVVAPDLEHVVIDLAGVAFRAPHHKQRTLHLVAGTEVGVVHVEIAGGAGAVVLGILSETRPTAAQSCMPLI